MYAGEKEDRMMMTGMHTVVDIYCVKCGSYLGWRYVNKNTSKSFLVYNVSWYQPFVCLYFRSLLLRRAKSTRKANLFLKGLYFSYSSQSLLFFSELR